ncbi:hypothetical protein NE619_03895 [Anaerovorax odorimutans]|uniref:Uncharacterized protein n=1 Tax=Anaerovorax odorimutans TaxID=109327 RepID=A0ABT1RKZ2_9FIRM|nr:hypothetical protein [Anaerovorax odorimutans]MCQ4635860.1 hypothetical protein [Anaerovorax odorimutans]
MNISINETKIKVIEEVLDSQYEIIAQLDGIAKSAVESEYRGRLSSFRMLGVDIQVTDGKHHVILPTAD